MAICADGSLIGLNWQSYHFAGTWIWLASFLVTALLFYRSEWKVGIRTTGTKFKLLLLTLPVMLMMAPNIVCLLESKDYVFPLRRLPSNYSDILSNGKPLPPAEGDSTFIELGLRVPSELMNYTGAYIKGWNLLQTLSPIANGNTHGLMNDRTWGHPTESYIFLGALIWAIAIYGFFVGKHPHRTLFAVPLLVFGLLMMGPPAGLHRLLFRSFPPLWFVRHTQLFLPFFLFSGFYFFCIGCEAALKNTSAFNLSNQWRDYWHWLLFLLSF